MSHKRALIVAALAMALPYGCARYQPAPLSAADNARDLESRRLDEPRLLRFIAAVLGHDDKAVPPPPRWRLTTLTLAALYYHPDISVARANLAGAEAGVITAREIPNPVLNFTNMIGQAAVAGAIPAAAAPVTIGPVIDFLVETAGKRERRTERARLLVDAARWDLATAEWHVRTGVRDALLELWSTRERLALTRQRLALQEQLVELLEHRLAEGAASAIDVGRERVGRAQIVLALGDLDRRAAEARVKLATAIGVPVRGLDKLNADLRAFDDPPRLVGKQDAGEWRREALTQRSDVRAGLAAYDAAQAALRVAVAGQFPNVTLGVGYNYDLGVNRYVLDLGATLPIFNQNQGAIAEALARRQQAAAAFTALQAQIIGAIDLAEAAWRNATRGVEAGDAILAGERRRASRVEAAFQAGQQDRPELVAAQLEVAAIALSRFDAVVQQRQALGSLEDALQRPLYEPGSNPLLPASELAP